MKTILYLLGVFLSVISLIYACRIRITPLPPPVDPPKVEQACEAPPILTNILGSWKWGAKSTSNADPLPRSAPFTTATFSRFGVITFGVDKKIIDPDSLFENHLDTGIPIIYKTYSLETDTVKTSPYYGRGEMFWIRLYYKSKTSGVVSSGGYYFKVICNDRNRIHLKGPDGAIELVLVR
ncbi:hypothetical protein [Spirosoma endophyticum]|nr:hypothetical protein [Spirosoma endophyticum]